MSYQAPLNATLPRFPSDAKYGSLHPRRRFAAWEDRMSAAVKITRRDPLPAELRVLATRSDDTAQTRRLVAIAMAVEGTSRLDAAGQPGMDGETLRDWVDGYNQAVFDGLASRKPPGASPN